MNINKKKVKSNENTKLENRIWGDKRVPLKHAIAMYRSSPGVEGGFWLINPNLSNLSTLNKSLSLWSTKNLS